MHYPHTVIGQGSLRTLTFTDGRTETYDLSKPSSIPEDIQHYLGLPAVSAPEPTTPVIALESPKPVVSAIEKPVTFAHPVIAEPEPTGFQKFRNWISTLGGFLGEH